MTKNLTAGRRRILDIALEIVGRILFGVLASFAVVGIASSVGTFTNPQVIAFVGALSLVCFTALARILRTRRTDDDNFIKPEPPTIGFGA